jgi:uncharacterized protein YdaL
MNTIALLVSFIIRVEDIYPVEDKMLLVIGMTTFHDLKGGVHILSG